MLFVRHSRALVLALAGALVGGSLAAQVGHDPAHSPFKDLRYGQFLSVTGGYMLGAGGKLGIGPHDGQVVSLRHDFLADKPLSISLGGGFARLDRKFADTVSHQIKGPVQHDLYFGELLAQLNLVGGRTWHGLAPYVNLGLGL